MSERHGDGGQADGFDGLARAWQATGPDTASVRAGLERARRRMRNRRIAVVVLLVLVEAFLLFLVLVGLRLGGPPGYVVILIAAALTLPWLTPIVRAGMAPPGGFGPASAAGRRDDPGEEILRLELEAQRALVRALSVPVPVIAFTLLTWLAVFSWSARAVHATTGLMTTHGTMVAAFGALAGWLVILGVAWGTTGWLLARARRSAELLGEALGDRDVSRQCRRAGRVLLLLALVAGAGAVTLTAYPWTWWSASREWKEHLGRRWDGQSAAAKILAHRVSHLDRRLASRGTAVEAEALPEAIDRVRGRLAEAARSYLAALRAPGALVGGEAAPVERARVDWLVSAEDALETEGVGPNRLAAELRRQARSPTCLALPVGERLDRLRRQDASTRNVDAELDCLLSTLVEPTSPLGTGSTPETPSGSRQ